MTKTEAADILANKALVMAREWDMPIGKDLIEAVLTEAPHWPGLYPAAAAAQPSWRTILRLAKSQAA